MNWKKVESYFSGIFAQIAIFFIINLLFFSRIPILSFSDIFKKPSDITITEGLSVLTLFALTLGILFFAGLNARLVQKYRLKTGEIKFINKISIRGAVFVVVTLLAIFSSNIIKQSTLDYLLEVLIILFLIIIAIIGEKREIKSKYRVTTFSIVINYIIFFITISLILRAIVNIIPEQQILWYYILIISGVVMLFGYLGENRSKLITLTLKMITYDESGRKKLETKENFELFDMTNIDYRLRDSTTGNEFIIPIGRVQEIIYKNGTYRSENMVKLKKEEEEVLYHIYKKKYATDYRPFRISDIISEYIGKYNRLEIINVIGSLVSQGFIVLKTNNIPHPDPSQILAILNARPELLEITERQTDIELCAPVVDKITEIKKLLRYRISINWLKENIVLTWQFLWKHFIVDIIVSALTAYIITKYIMNS